MREYKSELMDSASSSDSPPRPAARANPARGNFGRAVRRLLPALILAAALLFLFRTASTVGWKPLGERIAAARPEFLILSALAIVSRYALWGKRWQLLMLPIAKVSWWQAQKALMASVFFNTIIPAARPFGGLVRAGYLSRSIGCEAGPIYGTAFLDQTGYGVVSVLLGALSLPVALWPGRGWSRSPLLVLVFPVVLVGSLLLVWLNRDAIGRWMRRRMPAAAEGFEGALEAGSVILSRPRSWAVMLAGGAMVWGGAVLGLFLASHAVGAGLGMAGAAAAWSLGSMVGVASGTPGGAGTTESAALVPLLAMGVPADQALAAILLARLLEYLFDLVAGGLCALARPRPPV